MITLSISKLEPDVVNEDSVMAGNNYIAVSDGAGGGGLFADLWSYYLISHLPNEAIPDYFSFDTWLDSIWEPFYNNCEVEAQKQGGMILKKFYDEGSFATIVAVWKDGRWISYGDSVAFCYNKKTRLLQHSYGKLSDFNDPPYLINCIEPTKKKGFKLGNFFITEDSIVFATSDALAHYVIMMYEVSKREEYSKEISDAINAKSKNSNYIRTAMNMKNIDFEKDVINKIYNCRNSKNFKRHIQKLHIKGLIGHDDYSIVFM